MRFKTLLFWLMLVLASWPSISQAQFPAIRDYCLDDALAEEYGLSDLYCVHLAGIPALIDASGFIRMIPADNPYGVAVTPDGRHAYQFEFTISGLPDPSTLGDYTAYIAWAMPPNLYPVIKLGEVGNGTYTYGDVAFNKFRVLITAEQNADVELRSGKLVMRGTSPSNRMEAHDLIQSAPLSLFSSQKRAETGGHAGHQMMNNDDPWTMPPMHPAVEGLPGMHDIRPTVQPFQFVQDDQEGVQPRQHIKLTGDDAFVLSSQVVNRSIANRNLSMLAFNGQHPGPLIDVPQNEEVTITFANNTPMPSAIHWHGLRLNYRFDGVPGLTQDLVQPGETFDYKLYFPDTGLYWFHPHHREDIQMDLGLYANILVRSPNPDFFNPVHREEVIMLDDILLDDDGVVAHGDSSSNYMLMGRFGNTFLINGSTDYQLDLKRGEVVRFYITNTSNTRTYNLSFGRQPFKLVGSDVGKFERETWQESLVIAVAERYLIELQFDEAGSLPIENRVQSINHRMGLFFPEADTLGWIQVSDEMVENDLHDSYNSLRENADVIADIDAYRDEFHRPVDYELVAKLEVEDLPPVVEQLMRYESVYFNPVEWSGTMPMMNWASTGNEVQWILEDAASGKQNMDIDWRFKVGDVVKIRLKNDRNAWHAMQHPIHIHGQRFLVLSRDGVPNNHLVWKDTTILPAGASADILLELSNPGKWMVHCHIAEHIDSGMMFVFDVEE